MADGLNLCLGCMNEKSGSLVCPHCGWREGTLVQSVNEISPGSVLAGRYLVGKKLGQRRFEKTYIGYELPIRLKVLVKEYRLASESAAFGEKARLWASFAQHHHVVPVRNFFEENGIGFMVVEHIDGLTLVDYLSYQREGRLDVETALRILNPVMDALRAFHDAGVVHGDINPDSIFVTAAGQIKVRDFLAVHLDRIVPNTNDEVSIYVAGYAAMEQYCTSQTLGPWTDVYCAAATMFRMITGQTPPEPFARADLELLKQPSSMGVQINLHQEKILFKAMSVSSTERFQSIREFQTLIGSVATGEMSQPKETKAGTADIEICIHCGKERSTSSRYCRHCGKTRDTVPAKTAVEKMPVLENGAFFLEGKPLTGYGTASLPNGIKYQGDFVNGKFHGKGSYRWPNGSSYEGDFVDGSFHGKGVKVSSNGNRYEGEFVRDLPHGFGELTQSNGYVVIGQWNNGEYQPSGAESAISGFSKSYAILIFLFAIVAVAKIASHSPGIAIVVLIIASARLYYWLK